MHALEHMVRSFARRISQNGDVALVSDGHPALVSAFKELGWSDPYPDPQLLAQKPVPRAVMPPPKGRIDGGV